MSRIGDAQSGTAHPGAGRQFPAREALAAPDPERVGDARPLARGNDQDWASALNAPR